MQKLIDRNKNFLIAFGITTLMAVAITAKAIFIIPIGLVAMYIGDQLDKKRNKENDEAELNG